MKKRFITSGLDVCSCLEFTFNVWDLVPLTKIQLKNVNIWRIKFGMVCADTVSCAAKSKKVTSSMCRRSGLSFTPHMRKVLSGQLFSTGIFYSVPWFLKRTLKAHFGLCRWVGWSRFSLSVYARRHDFAWRGPDDVFLLRGLDTLGRFLDSSAKGHNACDFLFTFLDTRSFLK